MFLFFLENVGISTDKQVMARSQKQSTLYLEACVVRDPRPIQGWSDSSSCVCTLKTVVCSHRQHWTETQTCASALAERKQEEKSQRELLQAKPLHFPVLCKHAPSSASGITPFQFPAALRQEYFCLTHFREEHHQHQCLRSLKLQRKGRCVNTEGIMRGQQG